MVRYLHQKTYKDGLTLDQMLGKWGIRNYNRTEWNYILEIYKDEEGYYYQWIKYNVLSKDGLKRKHRVTNPNRFANYYKLQETPDDIHVEDDY